METEEIHYVTITGRNLGDKLESSRDSYTSSRNISINKMSYYLIHISLVLRWKNTGREAGPAIITAVRVTHSKKYQWLTSNNSFNYNLQIMHHVLGIMCITGGDVIRNKRVGPQLWTKKPSITWGILIQNNINNKMLCVLTRLNTTASTQLYGGFKKNL